MKKCFKCKVKKDLSLFYRHKKMADGHLNKCIDCTKKDVRSHRATNLEYYIAYDKARANLPHRVKARTQYQKTNRGKESHIKANKKWRELNAEKYAAHIILNNRLRDGHLKKRNCKLCNAENSQAHHHDYSKPLEVEWYCPKCHEFKHKVMELKL
jgi:hypothetical protein